MTVIWLEQARADLRSVRATIARNSERYADRMVARVVGRTGILSDHPRIGAVVPEEDDDDFREVFEHPYRILYRVYPDRVEVVAVIHSARRLPKGL